ncbi:MAG: CvpA family protein [Oscillospiraceae bacterium]
MTVPVIIDCILAAVLLICVIVGARRGLLESLAGLVILIVALVGASLFASTFTPTATQWLQPLMTQRIEQKVDAALRGDTADAAADTADPAPPGGLPTYGGLSRGDNAPDEDKTISMPEITPEVTEGLADGVDALTAQIQKLLETMGFHKNLQAELTAQAQEKVRETGVAIATAVAESLLQSVVHTVLFALSFGVLVLILRILFKAMHLVLQLPGLHLLNGLGGAAIGLVQGLLALFLAAWVAAHFGVRVSEDTIRATYILQFFVTNFPLDFLTTL